MNRLQQIALVAVVAFATLGVSGCIIVDDNATITCDNFDAYLASCDPGCVLDYDATCESYYDSYPDPAYLDDCADCLALETGSCYDCDDADGYSCYETLLYELGAYCDYY